jgi:HEAT repeat protein
VAVRASSSKQIATLIADLGAGSAATREAAVARLTVIGSRAVEPLVALGVSAAAPAARVAALRTLEAIGDPRALAPALQILSDAAAHASVSAAAVGVARVFLLGTRGAAVVDRLTAIALDRTRAEPLRLAALRALRALQPATIAPILASLGNDPSDTIRSEAGAGKTGAARRTRVDPVAMLTRAAEQGLPEESGDPGDPGEAIAMRRALSLAGDAIALPLLLRLVERLREREASEPARRDEWMVTRAATHMALASRGSRLALYDLRESLASAPAPLPVELLAALSLVGDASCLESIAAAHANARDAWWRDHLARAFRDIVTRERLTKRHAVVKRIAKRSPQTLLELWPV